MTTDLENSSAVNDSTVSGEASFSSAGNQTAAPPENPPKKKRNLAGMPGNIMIHPDFLVI